MSPVLSKKQMTEEDIKLQYITPAIQSKWGLDRMTMETRITDGRINLKGNLVAREKPKKADYVLYLNKYKPIAIVEAKDNNHSISYGLQQAKTYAQMLDVPFAYSSNGDGFQEYDFFTGVEHTLSMDEFPSIDELTARWEAQGITDSQKKVIAQPYYSSQNTYDPRYYQRNAINRINPVHTAHNSKTCTCNWFARKLFINNAHIMQVRSYSCIKYIPEFNNLSCP